MSAHSPDSGRTGQAQDAFRERFGSEPDTIVRAPGRVGIIGGHTDFNHGYIIAAAISMDVLVAASASGDSTVEAYSRNYRQACRFPLDAITRSDEAPWSNYVRGVAGQILGAGIALPGVRMVIDGNVPPGGGLSSSAALEVACALAMLELSRESMEPLEVAKLCQRAENEFVGVGSGIMDQFTSLFGQTGKAVFLDCRSLSHRTLQLPPETSIVVADSRKARELSGSEYNSRRAQCEETVRILREKTGREITHLRDVLPDDLERFGSALPEDVRKRAEHVVGENSRVVECAAALEAGDARTVGELMNLSHASSRDLYQSSCVELNALQEAAVAVDGCLGSRLTGAGFGGCTVSLVQDAALGAFKEAVSRRYREKTRLEALFYVLSATQGAGRTK